MARLEDLTRGAAVKAPTVQGAGRRRRAGGTVNRKGARRLVCGTAVPFDHVRAEGRAGRMGAQPMAMVAGTSRGRVYLESSTPHEQIAATAQPQNVPETYLPEKALSFRAQAYGMTRHRDLFTLRQLVALTTLTIHGSEAFELR